MTNKATALSHSETRVLEMIPRGMYQAKPVSEIADVLEMDVRSVHGVIADLCIKYYIPIVSTRSAERKGVFIAVTEEEKLRALAEFESQVQENQKRINAVKKANVKEWQQNIVYHYQTELLSQKLSK